jgi:hypothetical protein
MAKHITASGAVVVASNAQAILIQVNTAITGSDTITVTNGGSTQYGTSSGTIAIITAPAAGTQFKYSGLAQQGAISVNPSTTCDITVSILEALR